MTAAAAIRTRRGGVKSASRPTDVVTKVGAQYALSTIQAAPKVSAAVSDPT